MRGGLLYVFLGLIVMTLVLFSSGGGEDDTGKTVCEVFMSHYNGMPSGHTTALTIYDSMTDVISSRGSDVPII